jgi:hypothetical protein
VFVAEVRTLGIGPVAAHPMTLKLLLYAARKGTLPKNRTAAAPVSTTLSIPANDTLSGVEAGACPGLATGAAGLAAPRR